MREPSSASCPVYSGRELRRARNLLKRYERWLADSMKQVDEYGQTIGKPAPGNRAVFQARYERAMAMLAAHLLTQD